MHLGTTIVPDLIATTFPVTVTPRTPLLAITSLRFLAALMVVASHLSPLADSKSPSIAWLANHVFYEGYVGVTFFFLLSGFILSYSYSDRAEAGRLRYADFMFTRFARIVPLHLLTLLVSVPIGLYSVLKGVASATGLALALPLNAALLQAYVPVESIYFSLNAPSWSLSVEMFFYALFPYLIAWRSRSLAALAIVILLLKWVVAVMAGAQAVHFLIYVFPPLRLIDFVLGIILFRAYRRWRTPTQIWATAMQALSVVILVTFFAFKDDISQAARFDVYYVAPMSILILSFAWEHGWLAKLISNRAMVYLGEASFALYLVHQLVIRYAEPLRLNALHLSSAGAGIAASIAYVLASVGISAMLFSFFEMKAKERTLNVLRNWWAGRLRPPETLGNSKTNRS